MGFRFDGKVALVTGGAMGIGAATAQLLCELGASVAVLDLDRTQGTAMVDDLQKRGHKAVFYRCDVSSLDAMSDAVRQTEERFGAVHLLVSNAGIQRYGDVVSTSVETWDQTLRVNVQGCFHAIHAAIPSMLRAGSGSIVVTGSAQTLAAARNSAAYVTAKHALMGLVRSVALDFATRGIRANCILPGTIDTPLLHAVAAETKDPDRLLRQCAQMHPLGRIGQPIEVARAIAFLLSDWASFITGASLLVDGGLLLPIGGMSMSETGLGESNS